MFFLYLGLGYWVACAALALTLQPDHLKPTDWAIATGIALAFGPIALLMCFAAILRGWRP